MFKNIIGATLAYLVLFGVILYAIILLNDHQYVVDVESKTQFVEYCTTAFELNDGQCSLLYEAAK
jgi:hypothetical protein